MASFRQNYFGEIVEIINLGHEVRESFSSQCLRYLLSTHERCLQKIILCGL